MQIHTLPNGGKLTYLNRDDWGGGALRKGRTIALDNFRGLVLHHTPELPKAMGIKRPTRVRDTAEAVRFMRRLQTVRPDLGSEVPYSWVILRGVTDADAIVCAGRGQGLTGAHTANMNSKRYGVALAQNTNEVPMTEGQVEAFRWIGAGFLTVIDPEPATQHNDWAHVSSLNNTECAGRGHDLARLQPPYAPGPAPEPEPPLTVVPDPPAAGDPLPVIRPGDSGPAVVEYQVLLNVLLELIDRSKGDTGSSIKVTGVHDETTVSVTRSFQTWAGITVDGIVGNLETRPTINRALAVASASAVRREFGLTPLRPHPGEFGNLANPWRWLQ